MSRARELAKVGGKNQQVISGLSTHVGISTFAKDVVMYEDLTVNGNTAVGGNLTVTGTTTFNGGTLTLGDAATDNVVFGGDVNSNIIPNTDNAYDLGSSSQEWKDLYVDGTANIDSLVADTADINGGTADNVVIGGSTAAAGSFTTVAASSNVTVTGTLDVDGATTVDGFTAAEAAVFSAGVTITGALDANGGASIDNVQIGVTNDNEIDTASGNLVIDSAGGTTTVDDNLTVSGNLTVNGTTTTINSTTVAIDDKNFQVATGAADDAAADGGGLTVDSGDGDKTWNFEATGDNWGSSENINAASGKVYKINNTSVLSATTLGGAVVNSSLQTLGTIGTGVWQGTAIANGYLANSTVSYGGVSLSLGGSDGTPAFDLSDATNYPTSSLSGTITNAQLAGSITNAKLAGSIANSKLSTISTANKVSLSALDIDGGTDIGAALVDADLFIVDDGAGGTNRSITASAVKTYMGAAGGAFSVSNLDIDGATDIGADIVNADEIIIDDGGGGTNRRSDMTRVKKYIWSSASGDATASDSGAITLAASGVSAATYGSSTALPVITVDAKGRITSATTSAIDSTAISQGNSSMTVTDSGTGSIIAAIDGSTLATFAAAGITLSSGAFVGNVTGNVTGNTSGSSGSCTGNAATATLAATSTITANNSTDETVYPVFVDGATGAQGLESDTGFSFNPSSGIITAGGLACASLDISGNADIDGTMEADAYTVNGTALSTYIAGITVTNASTAAACSGNSATATTAAALTTARTIAGVSFDGSANISLNNNAITNGAGYVTSSGWTSSNDGAGSGLDADLLDGVQGSSYLRSDTSDTFSGTLTVSGNIVPNANGTRNLGASGTRWANVYSSDLDLSNEAKGGNQVDGSWGSYLIEEGENDLFLKNRRTGKQYKFVLQEV